MRLPGSLARFNKKVTNRVQGLWAPYLAPYAVIEHVGRKSGSRYSVPVVGFVDGDRFSVILAYGPDTDWVKNITAAGRFDIIRRGKRYTVTDPRVVPSDSPDMAKGARLGARGGVDHVLTGTILEEPA
ncbi:nitroreductase family deazaflavin-dependent oxidoreductase [Gordonia sp. (in: high G+C Gram-positive bacteria)]|uniref:nitroreductase family deazaflavin-dependent oxidoreductase n=1 Tax=Gordonia sp. (in: high G+C Gram-positive bacteria) TaxID=84139 RepID=UPI0039E5626D